MAAQDIPSTVPGLAAAAAVRWPAREAVVDLSGPERLSLSFDELWQRGRDTAKALMALGVEAGDRVAIWAPNIWEWPVALLGLQAAGAALVPLNTRYKGVEAHHILEASGAVALFTVEGFLGNDYVSMLRDVDGDLPALRHTIVLRGSTPGGALSCEDFLAAAASVSDAELDERLSMVNPEGLADLLFTSGTTGAPKGVMCTHGQTTRAFRSWAEVIGLRDDDRYLCINPFFHAFGYKAGIVACLTTGATLIPLAVFDVSAAMSVIPSEQITTIPGPPTLYQTILNHPDFDPVNVATLRLAVTGAASVPVELIRQMREVLGFDTVITGYGLTEACGIATMCRHDDDVETIALTSGRAIDGVEVDTVDDAGTSTAPGTPGEVVVRGYNVMLGYFGDPEKTAETIDDSGWLHTGDIGVLDERGYLRITDRLKDMFIVGGFNVYPAEVENLMSEHPALAQVAVVGVPEERLGEVGVAFVVPTLGHDVDVDDVVAWCRDRMANFKVPRRVEVVESLPTNAGGKVMKFELRARAIGEER